jgi:hypothetical protein
MRQMWTINSGPLPPLVTHFALAKGEQCYYAQPVDWYENRTVTKRVNYSGTAMRIKIMKGWYWNSGNYDVQRITQDVLTKIDTGVVYLTNKRILFDGTKKNQSIALDKIFDIVRYGDGIGIEKDTGRSPVLAFNKDIHVFAAVLARLIRDNE